MYFTCFWLIPPACYCEIKFFILICLLSVLQLSIGEAIGLEVAELGAVDPNVELESIDPKEYFMLTIEN